MHDDAHTTQFAIRPTRITLFMRSCILWQLVRFIIINVRMTVMIMKSHHTRLPARRHERLEPRPAAVKR